MGKYYLAVDVGATKTLLGIFNKDGNLVYKVKFLTCKNSFYDNLNVIIEKTSEYLESFSLEGGICGIGVGLPAVYNREKDIIQKTANLKKWEGSKAKEIIKSKINTQVAIHTDVYATLLGEKTSGIAKEVSNFISISLGTGVGMGIFINNSMYTGANGFAGGIGHSIYEEGGYQCNCGKRGCVEKYVCGQAMERLFLQKIKDRKYESSPLYKSFKEGEKTSSFEIIKGAHYDDRLCVDIIEEIAYNLGIIVFNVIMLFDPELIILNGGIINNSPSFFINKVKNTVFKNLFSDVYDKTRIETSILGENAALYGNYMLIKNQIDKASVKK